MKEIISLFEENRLRTIALIGSFIIIVAVLYFFFAVMISCLNTGSTSFSCLKNNWLFYLVTVLIAGVLYIQILKIISQISFNYKVRDDYFNQIRRRAELENIKMLKDMKYKVNENKFSNSLRELIKNVKERKR